MWPRLAWTSCDSCCDLELLVPSPYQFSMFILMQYWGSDLGLHVCQATTQSTGKLGKIE